MKALKEYCGVIHIHTKYSDGSGELKDIVADAQSCGLDFIIITDHNTLRLLKENKEAWYKDLLVIVGEEVTTPEGHCLALNIKKGIHPSYDRSRSSFHSDRISSCLSKIKEQGGLSIVVHPHLSDRPEFRIRKCAWRYWDGVKFDGLEIWSYMHDWVEHLSLTNLIAHCRHPERYITGPFEKTLNKWDELAQQRSIFALGGVDAHARVLIPFGLIKIFPYKMLFNTIRTYVLTSPLTPDFKRAKATLLNSIASGHSFIANFQVGDASGFRFFCEQPSGPVLMLGDETHFQTGSILKVFVPKKAHIKIIRDGKTLYEEEERKVEHEITQPGVYRVEVYLKRQPWIFSNPIYLR